MWKRLTEEEIDLRYRQLLLERRSLKKPLILGFVVACATFALFSAGFRGSLRAFSFTTPSFKVSHVIVAIIGGAVVAGIYYKKRAKSLVAEDDYLRCRGCFELTRVNPASLCACGGQLEPSEFFTWVEENENS